MLLPFDFALLQFIPFARTGLKLIKKLLGLGLVGGMALKKFGNMVLNMPRQLLRTVIKIQMEIIYLPLRLINSFYRLVFKPNKVTCNCDKTLQNTSKRVSSNIESYVHATADLDHISPCHMSVQTNTDMEEESSCHKSTQANADMEQELPCHKSVQVNADLEDESSYHKSTQANADLEQESSCNKYVQVNADMEKEWPCHKFVQVAFDLRQELPHSRSVQTHPYFQSNLTQAVKSVNKDNRHKNIDDENFVMQDYPNVKSADFIRYSEIVKRRTLKLIDELSNITKLSRLPDSEFDIPKFLPCNKENLVHEYNLKEVESLLNKLPDENSVEAMRSVKCVQHKRERLSQANNSSSKCILTEAVPTIKKVIREFDCQEKGADIRNIFLNSKRSKNNESFQTVLKEEFSGTEETHHNAQQVLNLSIEVLRSLVDIVTQEIVSLKHRLVSTNSKIEEIRKSSDTLSEEISKINERFNRLTNLSNKITDLQRELCDGHRLFQEVEADRNDMQLKLHALERMIKEEEEYLDDVSYESGYDELEIRATSPYKHDY